MSRSTKQTSDKAKEAWLRADVVVTYDAMKADPSRAQSTASVRAALEAEHKRVTQTED